MTMRSTLVLVGILVVLVALVFVVPRLWVVAPSLVEPPEVSFGSVMIDSVSSEGINVTYSVSVFNPNELVPLTIDRVELEFFVNNKSVGESGLPEIQLKGMQTQVVESDAQVSWEGAAGGGVSYLLNTFVNDEKNILVIEGVAFVELPTGTLEIPFSREQEI